MTENKNNTFTVNTSWVDVKVNDTFCEDNTWESPEKAAAAQKWVNDVMSSANRDVAMTFFRALVAATADTVDSQSSWFCD